MSKLETALQINVGSELELRNWLSKNHNQKDGVWLVFEKGDKRTITYDQIVEQCLCFGWIDSLPRKRDDGKSQLYIAPRKKGGVWSGLNKRRIEKLESLGLIMTPGQKAIEEAKKDGSWDKLTNSDNLVPTPELTALLTSSREKRDRYNSLTDSQKRIFLERLWQAKTPATKTKRLSEL
jgi:uncharacterized protein YdeI (YjbR/CyaY-like superfamily)